MPTAAQPLQPSIPGSAFCMAPQLTYIHCSCAALRTFLADAPAAKELSLQPIAVKWLGHQMRVNLRFARLHHISTHHRSFAVKALQQAAHRNNLRGLNFKASKCKNEMHRACSPPASNLPPL